MDSELPGPKFSLHIYVERDAVMCIPNPVCDPHIEWMMRYADIDGLIWVRFMAAEMIAGYSSLLSADITMKEATSRLRKLRAADLQAEKGP